jgi:4-hydroxy-tetrahydrodipicolinate synthase
MDERVRGVWCATLTPLDRGGNVDHGRFAAHVSALFDSGVNGVAPFGTTGEGQSFTVAERKAGIDRLLQAGIAPSRLLPATGCAALGDAIELCRHALGAGCVGALALPPFFFKDIGDDGVFASFARLIDGVRDARLKLYLYHIPQMSGVPIGYGAIERLIAQFGTMIAGVKDSAGDLAHTLGLVRRFPSLNVLTGHEPHLPDVLAAGGAGTICGIANLYPSVLRRLHDATSDAERAPLLEHVRRVVRALEAQSIIPALKTACGLLRSEPAWFALREPLVPLDAPARAALAAALRGLAQPELR